MVCGKKRLSTREKFKGDLYWKQCWYHSGTEFSRYDATGARRSWGYCLLGEGGAQNFLGPRGVKYLNTGLLSSFFIWWSWSYLMRSIKSPSSSLCSFLHSPVTSFLSHTILWRTYSVLSLHSSRQVTDQIAHPYKTGKIIVLYILLFMLLDSTWEGKRFRTRVARILFCSQFLRGCKLYFLMLFPNIWTLTHFQRIYYLSSFCDFVLHTVHST